MDKGPFEDSANLITDIGVGIIAFVVFMLFVVPPILKHLARRRDRRKTLW